MSQQIINNGETGLVVRGKINDNFTELYGAIVVPVKMPGKTANFSQVINANTLIQDIFINPSAGTPSLRIGTTPNGEEILAEMVISSLIPVVVQYFCAVDTTFYFTIIGSGTLNFRMDVLNNFF